ncbi:hypothetical protein KWG64_16625 [Rahnella sp. PD12R]|uniref:hypothetical protein n=1 Tax=Rahnella sp. PD12R TaxID=2855688 RepID=UPI001C43E044|nr:hypothetical protein [Rahnella sp. PD12R]MBV6819567.1 hypothetical protein [Rahnella sp. PD12R]
MKNICNVLLTLITIAFGLFFLIATIYMIFVCSMMFYTMDGKEYTEKNVFDYYFLTPSVLKNAPKLSVEAIYLSQGDDDYGFTSDKVTWTKVKDTKLGEEILKVYLIDNGIDIDTSYKTGQEYAIESVGDQVSLEIVNCQSSCNEHDFLSR